jgi:fatty acid-binding protein DegV
MQLAEQLSARLVTNLEGRTIDVGEVGAVIGAHTGPGMVGVVVAPA